MLINRKIKIDKKYPTFYIGDLENKRVWLKTKDFVKLMYPEFIINEPFTGDTFITTTLDPLVTGTINIVAPVEVDIETALLDINVMDYELDADGSVTINADDYTLTTVDDIILDSQGDIRIISPAIVQIGENPGTRVTINNTSDVIAAVADTAINLTSQGDIALNATSLIDVDATTLDVDITTLDVDATGDITVDGVNTAVRSTTGDLELFGFNSATLNSGNGVTVTTAGDLALNGDNSNTISSTNNIVLQAGVDIIAESFSKITLLGIIPIYADNATAISGGLNAGDVYRTAAGQLMIVF